MQTINVKVLKNTQRMCPISYKWLTVGETWLKEHPDRLYQMPENEQVRKMFGDFFREATNEEFRNHMKLYGVEPKFSTEPQPELLAKKEVPKAVSTPKVEKESKPDVEEKPAPKPKVTRPTKAQNG